MFFIFCYWLGLHLALHSFPTRRSSDLCSGWALTRATRLSIACTAGWWRVTTRSWQGRWRGSWVYGWSSRLTPASRSEEHTSELQSLRHLVCRLLLEKKKSGEQARSCCE